MTSVGSLRSNLAKSGGRSNRALTPWVAVLLVTVTGCATGGAAAGALSATPWKDVEKLAYSGWTVLSEQPRVLMRSRTSAKKVQGDEVWADGFVTELDLKSEYDRAVRFDLEVKAPGGTVRCAPVAIRVLSSALANPVHSACPSVQALDGLVVKPIKER